MVFLFMKYNNELCIHYYLVWDELAKESDYNHIIFHGSIKPLSFG